MSEPFSFHGKDGVPLAGYSYAAQNPTRFLVGIHGMAEHAGRYEDFGVCLSRSGVSLTIADLRGHGRSGGRRGHIRKFSDYLDDASVLVGHASPAGQPKPFLFGHSLGGLIALAYALRWPESIAGVIVSSPALGSNLSIPPLQMAASTLLDRIWPTYPFKNTVDPNDLSRNPEVGRAYMQDPLILRWVSVRFFRETLRWMDRVGARAQEIKLPLLMLLGSRDKIVPIDQAQTFYEKISSAERELKVYRGYLHEILQDPERDLVYDDILRWIHDTQT